MNVLFGIRKITQQQNGWKTRGQNVGYTVITGIHHADFRIQEGMDVAFADRLHMAEAQVIKKTRHFAHFILRHKQPPRAL